MRVYKNEVRKDCEGYILVSGVVDGAEFGCPDFEMKHAETLSGNYIGNQKTADFLLSKGIVPELIEGNKVCSIGFCEKEQKWYGWSHRAIYGFGVGDSVAEGDCCAESGWVDGVDPRTGLPDDKVLPVGFKAENLADAKRMAVAFASSVN
jgi:hypothetical protein